MLEARHYSAAAKRKGSYALPDWFDGSVNLAVLHQATRAYLNNQRQGTHSTKTRSEVSGGGRKPWRQKGTGRARQGTTRAPHWVGGGVAFGPKPRDYTTALPRKMKRLARQSAFNQRAAEGALVVIESLEFDGPKTRQMADLLGKLGLTGKKVLVLTEDVRAAVHFSARNIPRVRVLRYSDASALDVLWADALVVEESAIGGHAVRTGERTVTAGRAKRAQKAAAGPASKRASRTSSGKRSPGAGAKSTKRKSTKKEKG